MRMVHVLRKPLSEGTVAANTLKHGVGGLNIGASRIGSDAGWSYPNGAGGNGFHGGVGRPADGSRVEPVVSRGGRWPANVILQHLDGCRCDGTKKVRGSSEGQTGGHSWGLVNDDGWDPKGVPDQRSWMEDGKESVANWICVEGCPVRALDGQSGERPSTLAGRAPAHVVADNPGSCKRSGFTGGPEGKGVGGGAGKVYADTGGASRFFKQVGGKTDE